MPLMISMHLDIKLEDISGLPEGVEELRIETGEDATGDSAVWAWLAIRDDVLDRMDLATREKVRDIVSAEIRNKAAGGYGTRIPWVYVRFRGTSER